MSLLMIENEYGSWDLSLRSVQKISPAALFCQQLVCWLTRRIGRLALFALSSYAGRQCLSTRLQSPDRLSSSLFR